MRILRLLETESRTGLKRSAIYEAMATGDFPRQVPLGARAVGWLESEVEAWLAARVAERDTYDPRSRQPKRKDQTQ